MPEHVKEEGDCHSFSHSLEADSVDASPRHQEAAACCSGLAVRIGGACQAGGSTAASRSLLLFSTTRGNLCRVVERAWRPRQGIESPMGYIGCSTPFTWEFRDSLKEIMNQQVVKVNSPHFLFLLIIIITTIKVRVHLGFSVNCSQVKVTLKEETPPPIDQTQLQMHSNQPMENQVMDLTVFQGRGHWESLPSIISRWVGPLKCTDSNGQ